MKPVMSAYMPFVHAALRASSTWPRYSTMAASTGVGLFQCVQPQDGHRSRVVGPLSSMSSMSASGVAQAWQKRGWVIVGPIQAGKTPVDR